MYLDTRSGRIKADRVSLADLYFSIRLTEMAWHAIPAIMAVVACTLLVPAYVTWLVLTDNFGVDSTSAAGYGLGVAAVFWVLFAIRWRRRVLVRRAARVAAERDAEEQFRRSLSEWTPPGALPNPPAPWFSESGEPLWTCTAAGWVPVNRVSTVKAPTTSAPSLRVTRDDQIVG